MSVKVMAAVFERYPNGGGEMLLALALADHASDDGTRVFPSIKALAEKTRQSERTVQYQLRRMEEMKWLILVGAGNGGRSMAREYRISIDWIKGAEIAPFQKGANGNIKGANGNIKGATTGIKGCNLAQERVQPVAPANNHQGTIKEPSGEGERTDAQDGFTPPLMTGAICMVMKACGMQSVNPSHPGLKVLIDKGADIGLFAEVARDCVAKKKPFSYALAVIKGRMQDAAALADTALSNPTAMAASETNYQRSMRLRMAEFVPDIARKAPGEKRELPQNPTEFFRTIEAETLRIA
jgi:hypothetical protein